MKLEYIDLTLPDNTSGGKKGWFYLDNPAPALRERTGRIPAPGLEWTNQLVKRDTEELKPLLDDLEQLKAKGLTGATVAISFCRRLIQPLQGPPDLRVLGTVRPNPCCQVQGLQGGDDGSGEEHLRRADPQQGVPQRTRGV
jgi:hypothetical protein